MHRLSIAGVVFVSIAGCDGAANVPAATEMAPQAQYLVANTTLRLTPSSEEQVPNPYGEGISSNWVGQLFRGTRVEVRHLIDGWAEVTLPDGARGWVQSSILLAASDVGEVTLLADTEGYADPDRLQPAGMVPAASLLLVVDVVEAAAAGGSSRVNVEGDKLVWVASDALTHDQHEVELSHLLVKARWSAENDNMEDNARLFDKARMKHRGAKLLEKLADTVPFEDFSAQPTPGTAP